jgi:hypothetical protein
LFDSSSVQFGSVSIGRMTWHAMRLVISYMSDGDRR